MHVFTIPKKSHYIEETDKKIYWEIEVDGNEVRVIQRGGPLEPIALHLKSESEIIVDDDWSWGQG